MNEKLKSLLKILSIYVAYFIYTTLISSTLSVFGISGEVTLMFISDLVFFASIVTLYKDELKEGYKKFEKNYKPSKRIFFILKWVAILFGINMLGGIITELFFPGLAETGNTATIYSLASVSTAYIIFKTLIFATVAEELVFKKAIRELISNNTLFIITSSLVYALINVMYTNINYITLIDMVSYFLFSLVLSYVYVKNDDNIVMPIAIKFCYNLIPITIMIISMGG